jgi:hypothetical protein
VSSALSAMAFAKAIRVPWSPKCRPTSERKAMLRQWAQRERQIRGVLELQPGCMATFSASKAQRSRRLEASRCP